MKNEKPTTLELAQLAAQLHPQTGAERESIKQAMTLWAEAERELDQVQHRADYLRDLVTVIYTATPEEWQQRLDAFPGDRSDIDRELLRRVPAEKVHQTLFRNKKDSKQARKTLFVGLIKFAQSHEMEPPPSVHTVGKPVEANESSPYYNSRRLKTWDVVAKEKVWPKVQIQIDWMRQRLGANELTLHVVRWAVEVRQRQIAENKTRTVPQSLKTKPARDGDSTQFKPKHRA